MSKPFPSTAFIIKGVRDDDKSAKLKEIFGAKKVQMGWSFNKSQNKTIFLGFALIEFENQENFEKAQSEIKNIGRFSIMKTNDKNFNVALRHFKYSPPPDSGGNSGDSQGDYKRDSREDHKRDSREDHKRDSREDHKRDSREDHKRDSREDHKRDSREDHKRDSKEDYRNSRRNSGRDYKRDYKEDSDREYQRNHRGDSRNDRRDSNFNSKKTSKFKYEEESIRFLSSEPYKPDFENSECDNSSSSGSSNWSTMISETSNSLLSSSSRDQLDSSSSETISNFTLNSTTTTYTTSSNPNSNQGSNNSPSTRIDFQKWKSFYLEPPLQELLDLLNEWIKLRKNTSNSTSNSKEFEDPNFRLPSSLWAMSRFFIFDCKTDNMIRDGNNNPVEIASLYFDLNPLLISKSSTNILKSMKRPDKFFHMFVQRQEPQEGYQSSVKYYQNNKTKIGDFLYERKPVQDVWNSLSTFLTRTNQYTQPNSSSSTSTSTPTPASSLLDEELEIDLTKMDIAQIGSLTQTVNISVQQQRQQQQQQQQQQQNNQQQNNDTNSQELYQKMQLFLNKYSFFVFSKGVSKHKECLSFLSKNMMEIDEDPKLNYQVFPIESLVTFLFALQEIPVKSSVVDGYFGVAREEKNISGCSTHSQQGVCALRDCRILSRVIETVALSLFSPSPSQTKKVLLSDMRQEIL